MSSAWAGAETRPGIPPTLLTAPTTGPAAGDTPRALQDADLPRNLQQKLPPLAKHPPLAQLQVGNVAVAALAVPVPPR